MSTLLDVIDPDLFPIFSEEAETLIEQLNGTMRQWVEQPGDQSARKECMRLLHTFKGGARLAGAMYLGQMAHDMESAIGVLDCNAQQAQDIRPLQDTLDAIDNRFRQLQQGDSVAAQNNEQATANIEISLANTATVNTNAPPITPTISGEQLKTGNSSCAAQNQDCIDPDLFPIFSEEAETLIEQLNGTMRQWVEHPCDQNARKECMRLLHTFKGGARLAGAMYLGQMAHDMESAIGAFDCTVQQVQDIRPLQDMLDAIDNRFRQLLQGDSAVANNCEQAAAIPEVATANTVKIGNQLPENSAAHSATATGSGLSAVAMPVATHLAPQQTSQQQVRVRTHMLDRMLGQTGEVISSRARLESELTNFRHAMQNMDGSLERLRAHLRNIEVQAESQMQSRQSDAPNTARDFDPLEFDRFTRMQELTRMMAESVNDVASVQRSMVRSVQSAEDNLTAQARQARELQNDLLRTRMIEFDSLSERLHRVVRQSAKESGKEVALQIIGGNIEMDRSILDRVTSPFEHLLRNAIAHGIEPPEQRISMGKDATGKITITLYQEGNDVAITVRDDGRGLDVVRIREKAMAQGLLQSDAMINDDDAIQLIFQSGLSTAKTVTSLAGRGVGLDVVRTEVNALGGHISAETHQNTGTEFILVLPLTTAITQVVEVRAGDLHFSVPAHLIESVQRCSRKEIEQAYNSQTYAFNGERLPFYWSGAMLQSTRYSKETNNQRQIVVILRSTVQRIVMHVDAIIDNHEVVVKNIGPQLARMPGLAGVTILPDGRLLYIYNPIVLSVVYNQQIRAFSADLADPAVLGGEAHGAVNISVLTEVKPLILVVDDSITVRRVTERLLKRRGYRVALAADGMLALREIEIEKPAVVLSDIEMPKMDGFDLLRNIRNDEKLKNLPVIMITSRSADKHRDHSIQLGANDFLGKPYSEDQLLDCIRQQMSTQAINTSSSVY